MTDDAAFWAALDAKTAARRRDPLLTLDDGEDTIRQALHRRTRPLQVGGFRPTGAPDATCFGEVRLQAPGEDWPRHNGTPMFPLAQFNIAEADMQAGPLADTALVAVYMSPDFRSNEHRLSKPERSAGFAVRAYPSLNGLVPTDPPAFDTTLKPFECLWLDPVDDYPTHDLACDIIDGAEISVYDFDWYQNAAATKIGGWPSTLQSEPWWMYRPDAPDVEYALQIWYEEKARWYGHGLYLARGTSDPDLWALDMQMD